MSKLQLIAATTCAFLGATAGAFAPAFSDGISIRPSARPSSSSCSSSNLHGHLPRRQHEQRRYRRTTTTSLHAARIKYLTEIDDDNCADLLGGDKAVLVDACAPWCGPCKLIQPTIVRTATKWSKSVEVVKYNVENENSTNLRSLLQNLGVEISSLPTLVLFKNGKVLGSRSGVVTDMDVNVFLSSSLHRDREMRRKEEAQEETESNCHAEAVVVR
mmetsp:Transcript_19248/g.42730  ORF Transcript_19248/g.42730 Transcript_19248/m.42730 type:complete len:216 (-) Transcript_19248:46-693(-)